MNITNAIQTVAGLMSLLVLPLTMAVAAPRKTSSVVAAGGGRASGGTLSLVQTVAQPGGVGVSTEGTTVVRAGFLNTFDLKPDLDTDGDGLPNEADADNDNDGLPDESEISGAAFGGRAATDPNVSDSDGDGVPDGAEAASGTDPHDNTMYLQITAIGKDPGGDVVVTWEAVGGKTYTLYALPSPDAAKPGTPVATVTTSGGTGPWHAVTTNQVDSAGSTKRFYYVKLVP